MCKVIRNIKSLSHFDIGLLCFATVHQTFLLSKEAVWARVKEEEGSHSTVSHTVMGWVREACSSYHTPLVWHIAARHEFAHISKQAGLSWITSCQPTCTFSKHPAFSFSYIVQFLHHCFKNKMLLKTFKDRNKKNKKKQYYCTFFKTTVKSEWISADFALLVKQNKSFKNVTFKCGLYHLMVQGPYQSVPHQGILYFQLLFLSNQLHIYKMHT